MAQEHEAMQYWVEHRYYGESYPVNTWNSTQDYRFLSSEQALEDLAVFISTMKKKMPARASGLSRRWVVVGGSYPGALSAWFRYKYPHLADISWASSGVIHAITNFTEYESSIYNSTVKGGIDCTHTFQNLTHWLDIQYKNPNQTNAEAALAIFGMEGGNLIDLMGELADILAGKIQYGGRVDACKFADKIRGKPFLEQLRMI